MSCTKMVTQINKLQEHIKKKTYRHNYASGIIFNSVTPMAQAAVRLNSSYWSSWSRPWNDPHVTVRRVTLGRKTNGILLTI